MMRVATCRSMATWRIGWIKQEAIRQARNARIANTYLFWASGRGGVVFVRRKAGRDKPNSFASMWQRAVDQAGFPDLSPA